MEKEAQEILEVVLHVKENMATKDELAAFRNQHEEDMNHIRAELRSIKDRLAVLEEESKSHKGFAKELDMLFERVKRIETHLDLQAA